jgi:hypothetical protein
MKPLSWTQFALAGLVCAALALPAGAQEPPAQAPEGAADTQTATPPAASLPNHGITAAIDPPPAPPELAVLIGVIWTEQPDGRDYARLYPRQLSAKT